MNIEMISINDVKSYINQDEFQFIDLREPEEFNQKHIRGAFNIPFQDFEKKYQMLSKEKVYILYCDRGGSSLIAAKKMMREGYWAKSLNGGMNAFSRKNIE